MLPVLLLAASLALATTSAQDPGGATEQPSPAPDESSQAEPAAATLPVESSPPVEPPKKPATTLAVTEAGPVRLLVMDLRNDGVTPATQRIVGDALVVELTGTDNLEVLSSEDVRRMADFDASRTEIGCDEASCLAELANALGAQVVVYGSIGTLGRLIVVTLNVFDSQKARSVGRETIRADTLEELPPLIEASTRRLVGRIPGVTAKAAEGRSAWGTPWPYVGIGGSVVGASAAVVGGFIGLQGYETYQDTSKPAGDREAAQTQLFVGLGIGIGGLVVMTASAIGLAVSLAE